MTDWKIVKHDQRSRDGDVYEGDPIHTVVPAQPGYSVIELFEHDDHLTEEFGPVLAWIVTVTPRKVGADVDYRNETKPVSILALTDDYAIREPSGKIIYEHVAYNDLAELISSRSRMRQRLKEANAA